MVGPRRRSSRTPASTRPSARPRQRFSNVVGRRAACVFRWADRASGSLRLGPRMVRDLTAVVHLATAALVISAGCAGIGQKAGGGGGGGAGGAGGSGAIDAHADTSPPM